MSNIKVSEMYKVNPNIYSKDPRGKCIRKNPESSILTCGSYDPESGMCYSVARCSLINKTQYKEMTTFNKAAENTEAKTGRIYSKANITELESKNVGQVIIDRKNFYDANVKVFDSNGLMVFNQDVDADHMEHYLPDLFMRIRSANRKVLSKDKELFMSNIIEENIEKLEEIIKDYIVISADYSTYPQRLMEAQSLILYEMMKANPNIASNGVVYIERVLEKVNERLTKIVLDRAQRFLSSKCRLSTAYGVTSATVPKNYTTLSPLKESEIGVSQENTFLGTINGDPADNYIGTAEARKAAIIAGHYPKSVATMQGGNPELAKRYSQTPIRFSESPFRDNEFYKQLEKDMTEAIYEEAAKKDIIPTEQEEKKK